MTVLVRCRVEKKLLKKANQVTERLGTSTPEMIRIFLAEIARTGKVPVSLEPGKKLQALGNNAPQCWKAFTMQPRLGEVYWVDLGMAGKVRPLLVVSRLDPDATRALAVCVPLTTEIRGGDYEVSIPRVRWMPGPDEGLANIQGITSVEHHRLQKRPGQFEMSVVRKIRAAIAWMLELENPGFERGA